MTLRPISSLYENPMISPTYHDYVPTIDEWNYLRLCAKYSEVMGDGTITHHTPNQKAWH